MANARIRAVEDYLRTVFPGCRVEHRHDFVTGIQKFEVQLDQGPPLRLGITDELLEGVAPGDVAVLLGERAVGENLRQAVGGGEGLLVAADGLKTLPDE